MLKNRWSLYLLGLFFAFVFFIAFVAVCRQGFTEEDSRKGELKPADIKRILPDAKVDSFRYDEDLGLYEVFANGQLFYMSRDLRYAIVGNIIELQSRKNLTAERLGSLRRIDFSALNKDDAIKISTGSRAIAVFTDPECPFCKRLHNELKKLKDVSVYVFLYPLEAIHHDARKKSISIWCSKDRAKALDEHFSGKPARLSSEECSNPVDRNIQFARKHNINGTPAIILDSGRLISGYMDAERIDSLIKEASVEKR
jgi:thiol:disulfide interchange protein DsbC